MALTHCACRLSVLSVVMLVICDVSADQMVSFFRLVVMAVAVAVAVTN
jgi:hypothetical protein